LELKGRSVLIIDDNATNRTMLSKSIQTMGATTAEADGAKAALAWLQRTKFELVVLDFQMPEVSGLDLALAIRKDPSCGSPAIIMLSSVGDMIPVESLQRLGIHRNLSKPTRRHELKEALINALTAQGETTNSHESYTDQLAGPLAGMKILVAEDNPVNQKVATKILESFGCQVDVVANGLVAIEYSNTVAYDLILMDLQMPIIDGYEAAIAIRRNEMSKSRKTPIVALTAHALDRDRAKCLGIGMDGFLTKPIKPNVLFQEIQKWRQTERLAA
ncbi:MAG: response regulator, partial [Fimbriimonadaceae bacterium]